MPHKAKQVTLADLYPAWEKVSLTKAGYTAQRAINLPIMQSLLNAAKQEAVGDAIELDVPLETMQFVLSKIKAKPKTIAKRLLMQEWQVNVWFDGTADKYDLQVYIWRLKILASLTRRYNWAVFLLEPKNLPAHKANSNK